MGVFVLCVFIAQFKRAAVRDLHWFHGFVVTALAGFGGSILVPVLLGCHDNVGPFVLANDGAACFMAAAFALVHYVPGFTRVTALPGVRHAIAAAFELTRAVIVLVWLRRAEAAIASPSHFTAAPVVGPLILGTIAGCGGGFLPFDQGLAMLKDGAPYAMRSAFAVAAAYHFAAFNEGALLRQVAGAFGASALVPAVDERDARALLAVALVVARWARMGGAGAGGGGGGGRGKAAAATTGGKRAAKSPRPRRSRRAKKEE